MRKPDFYICKTKLQIRFALTIQLVTAFDVCFMDSTIHLLASSISSLTVQTFMCPANPSRGSAASSVEIVSKILKYNEMLTDIWIAVSVVKFEPNYMESLLIKYKIRDCRIVKLNWWYRPLIQTFDVFEYHTKYAHGL